MITGPTILVVLLLAIATFVVPRKYLVAPYVLGACFVPADQRVMIASLDFTMLRILIVAGVLRVFLRGEQQVIKWNTFDKLVLCWAFCGTVIYAIQWMDMRAVIFKCGVLFEAIGLYWLFRQYVRSWHDIFFIVKLLAICALITAPLVALEWVSGQNPFRILGRVMTDQRDGWWRYRCQASFPISIIMGLFWATLVPMFVGMARIGENRLLYCSAIIAGVFSVTASASSTSVSTLLMILPLLFLFRWRHYTRFGAMAFVLLLIAFHIQSSRPVWYLFARLRLIGSSTGWHRYHLIDQALKHFGEWALLGVRSSRHWGFGLGDVTNQYILEGIRGGLITLILFLVVIVMAFLTLARSFRWSPSREHQHIAWCLFVSLVGHCVAFIGVSYFGQIIMLWYLMLAFVAFLYGCKVRRPDKRRLARKPVVVISPKSPSR